MLNNIFQTHKKPPEYFVALELNSDVVGAAVFTTDNGKTNIIGSAIEKYSGSWDELIEATDSAVSKAAGEINLNELKKVVFGFPPHYLEGAKISQEVLPHLKKLTTELELTPSGFVVIPEAINFYLEQRGGGPQTSILIGVTLKELTLNLFRGGKLSDQITASRSENIIKDVEAGLNRFKNVEIFPSKILLYDGGDLEAVKEELLRYPWQNNSRFLHFPKIEVLTADFCLQSIVEAAASELKQTVPEAVPANMLEKQTYDKTKMVDPTHLGFVREGHAKDKEEDYTPKEINNTTPSGFHLSLPKIALPWFKRERLGEKTKQREEINRPTGFPQGILKRIPKWVFPVLLGLLVLFGGGFFLASSSLVKARVTLIVDPKIFEQEKEVVINPDIITPDEANNEIPGKVVSVEVTSAKTIPVTGKKIIGEPAKGTVTIYNKTGSSRLFDKGTKLSTGNLVFTLDDKIEVPAASESDEGLKYGKTNIAVTAAKIGPEGNLSSKTDFTVSDFSSSSYAARNDQAFFGGTSREVSAVSAKDQQNLLTTLTEELRGQAETEIQSKLVNGEKLLNESLQDEIVSRKFNSEVDQEAKELTLNLTMKFQGLTYQEQDFSLLMEKIVKANIPEDYEFKPEETSIDVSENLSDKGDKLFKFKAAFTAKLFPKVDTDKIKKEITGLPVSDLEGFVKTIPNVVGYELNIDTSLSFLKNSLPKKADNITITIKAR